MVRAVPLENEYTLILRAQKGDLDAFNQIVLHYQNRAYTLAYRLLGEPASAADAAQEAFINAWRKINTYRGGAFASWLLRIVANGCYDVLRRDKRHVVIGFEELPQAEEDNLPLPDPALSPEQAMMESQLQQAIQQCINALSPDQRFVLVLSDVEEFDYQTIADRAGVQLGTVKSRLSRARANVRDCLAEVKELLPLAYRLNFE